MLDQQEAVKLCMNNLHPWLALCLHGGAPATFETLSTTATNAEIHLQQNPDMLARLKGSPITNTTGGIRKAPTINVSVIDVGGSGALKSNNGVQARGKAIVLGDEENSKLTRKIVSLDERKKKEYPFTTG